MAWATRALAQEKEGCICLSTLLKGHNILGNGAVTWGALDSSLLWKGPGFSRKHESCRSAWEDLIHFSQVAELPHSCQNGQIAQGRAFLALRSAKTSFQNKFVFHSVSPPLFLMRAMRLYTLCLSLSPFLITFENIGYLEVNWRGKWGLTGTKLLHLLGKSVFGERRGPVKAPTEQSAQVHLVRQKQTSPLCTIFARKQVLPVPLLTRLLVCFTADDNAPCCASRLLC